MGQRSQRGRWPMIPPRAIFSGFPFICPSVGPSLHAADWSWLVKLMLPTKHCGLFRCVLICKREYSIQPSIHLSFHPSVGQSDGLSVWPIHQNIQNIFVSPSVPPSVYPSITHSGHSLKCENLVMRACVCMHVWLCVCKCDKDASIFCLTNLFPRKTPSSDWMKSILSCRPVGNKTVEVSLYFFSSWRSIFLHDYISRTMVFNYPYWGRNSFYIKNRFNIIRLMNKFKDIYK